MKALETIIGLEIHLQLKTKSKMFCACSNDGENQKPNTTVCPICLGHPGTLPTINKEAVKYGVMMALALACKINKHSKFDRKNYFYPDLPKGYQISQYDEPLAQNGKLLNIGIVRVHLEEDAGKNIHTGNKTLVDFNRCGTPLAEIVTEPDFRSPQETTVFLQELRLIARYLGISDADMEKGHLRCDANISLRPKGDKKFYAKIEIKNLNSFKAVERALQFEVNRQTRLWEQDRAPQITETRGWDEDKQTTVMHRSKESGADYRYFPEPDLPPLVISDELMKEVKSLMPELPQAREARFVKEYGLSQADSRILINQKPWAEYFEGVMSDLRAWLKKQDSKLWDKNKADLSKLAHNWLVSELFGLLDASFEIKKLKITAENFSELIKLVYKKTINSSAGQTILKEMYKTGDDPSRIAEKMDLAQIDDATTLEGLVIKVIMQSPDQVDKYKKGKTALLKYFVGQVMAESRGKANPQKAEEILKKKLA